MLKQIYCMVNSNWINDIKLWDYIAVPKSLLRRITIQKNQMKKLQNQCTKLKCIFCSYSLALFLRAAMLDDRNSLSSSDFGAGLSGSAAVWIRSSRLSFWSSLLGATTAALEAAWDDMEARRCWKVPGGGNIGGTAQLGRFDPIARLSIGWICWGCIIQFRAGLRFAMKLCASNCCSYDFRRRSE